MARRRHENGLKYQQRIESEQRERAEQAPEAPIPAGVTQLLENAAPQPFAPNEPVPTHDPHEP
jgi:hypothetical protein